MSSNTEHSVLRALEDDKGSFVSGGALATRIGVSRNAIWKAVRALQQRGYTIDSVTGKGYRLSQSTCVLSAESIESHLGRAGSCVEFHDEIDSTNRRCKELAEAGAPHGTLVVADCQTAGRGRQGRAFFSPAGSGVYFSLLLRPGLSLEDTTHVTSLAAVALARALDETCGVSTQIKWVNDVFCHGHKVSGILTEGSFDAEGGSLAYAVVGIGVNVFDPKGGFPADVAGVAHSVCGCAKDEDDTRARIIAQTTRGILDGLSQIPQKAHLAEYRRRSILDGRTIAFEDRLVGTMLAKVLGINDDFTLHVQLEDGSERNLVHGEVHIPSSQL